jgi:hypothetical protein
MLFEKDILATSLLIPLTVWGVNDEVGAERLLRKTLGEADYRS